ncbi:hypothetical protein APHAL10511_004136 [Amanita phalloides]|nr:hypothetical protein APHAL10511_004136 [Amanita phalloides]
MPRTRQVCEAFFSEAGCPKGRSCELRHDAIKCVCGPLLLRHLEAQHFAGKRHKMFMQQQDHLAGPVGPIAAGPGELRATTIEDQEEDRTERCQRCSKIVFAVDMVAHVAKHERQDRIQSMQVELVATEQDTEGIEVDMKAGIDFGVLRLGDTKPETVNIKRSLSGSVWLVDAFMRSKSTTANSAIPPPFSASIVDMKRQITIRKPKAVIVRFTPQNDGYCQDTLELVFARSNRSQFVITRRVCGTAGSPEDQEELKPTGKHKRRKWIPLRIDGPVIPGPRPPVWSRSKWVHILPKFKPPADLIKAAFQSSTAASLKAVKRIMPSEFNIDTYGDWFQTLVYIEGEQQKRDLDFYALYGEDLRLNNSRYELSVNGSHSERLSVLVGDYILVRRSGDETWYTGRVHEALEGRLTLYFSSKFNAEFKKFERARYDIGFVYNRLPERRKHQAVMSPYKPMRLLFPNRIHIRNSPVTRAEVDAVQAINRQIASNYEQLEAVAAILKQPPGSVPFVIFGPPGTGKTVTVVEAIHQLLQQNGEARILACAPSNKAADIIATRLSVLGKPALFRLNSLSRKPQTLASTLENFVLLNDNNCFAIPTLEELKEYKVIVSTCITAGALWGLGFKKGHFSHIFVDEAGHGEEPQVMIPFRTLADETTNFVLAGDHKQLGPIIKSLIARQTTFKPSLETSYLQRMMEREIYDVQGGRGLTVVKLVRNFRSHPDIIHFSNTHFYASELQACGDPTMTHSLQDIDMLPKKGFPIIFHGVAGRDQQEDLSPSYFNIEEASIVKNYCLKLRDQKMGIGPNQIGVITPYYTQKRKIQQLFRNEGKLSNIQVGTVDEFQGQERRIIIVSAVRSTPDHLTLDVRRSLGFVANPPRLNVIMTRAQALLIVIGNPTVLSLDPQWRSFLSYVHRSGGWQGLGITWNPEEPINLPQYNYSAQYREQAEARLEDTLRRLRATLSQNLEQHDIDTDLGADSDKENYLGRPIHRDAE